jgi:hypothetical protein
VDDFAKGLGDSSGPDHYQAFMDEALMTLKLPGRSSNPTLLCRGPTLHSFVLYFNSSKLLIQQQLQMKVLQLQNGRAQLVKWSMNFYLVLSQLALCFFPFLVGQTICHCLLKAYVKVSYKLGPEVIQ